MLGFFQAQLANASHAETPAAFRTPYSHFIYSRRDEGHDVVDGGSIKDVRDLAANLGPVP